MKRMGYEAMTTITLHKQAVGMGLVLSAVSLCHGQVLYDGSLNTLPTAQGWLYATTPLFSADAVRSVSDGLTQLDTTPTTTDRAGYFSTFHPDVPTLDRALGFELRWDLRVVTETHNRDDRAGFSVIMITEDLLGLEIGFWEDEVFVLEDDVPVFSHAEGADNLDTTLAVTRYDLRVLNDQYELFSEGVAVLAGQLRDYSSFGFPYNSSSFLFFGDDTTSAAASVELARIEVSPFVVPAPAVGSVVLIGLASGVLARDKRRVS